MIMHMSATGKIPTFRGITASAVRLATVSFGASVSTLG